MCAREKKLRRTAVQARGQGEHSVAALGAAHVGLHLQRAHAAHWLPICNRYVCQQALGPASCALPQQQHQQQTGQRTAARPQVEPADRGSLISSSRSPASTPASSAGDSASGPAQHAFATQSTLFVGCMTSCSGMLCKDSLCRFRQCGHSLSRSADCQMPAAAYLRQDSLQARLAQP